MNKKGQFSSILWRGSSVSALVAIVGLIIYLVGDKSTGILLIILGLAATVIMSPIGRAIIRR